MFKRIIKKFKHHKIFHEYPTSSTTLDVLLMVFTAWFLGGLYLDGWAHHQLDSALETFFTPWHGMFYSGFFACAILLIVTSFQNTKKGHLFRFSLPREYILSLVGVFIFFMGGIGDVLWHIIFGVEQTVEALLSPTHLTLALGGGLIGSGPLRSLWTKSDPGEGLLRQIPIIFSLAFLFSFLSFMTQYSHMVVHPWPSAEQLTTDKFFPEALGISNILIQTTLLMGLVLPVLKKWRFPFWGFTGIIAINTIGLSYMEYEFRFIPAALIAGMIIDFLYQKMKNCLGDPFHFRLFAFLVPVVLYISYFGAIFTTKGTWWSIHLWAGSIVIAGLVGWLLSYLVLPPYSPISEE